MMILRIFSSLFVLLLITGCYHESLDECPAMSPGYCKPARTCCCLEKDPNLINKIRTCGAIQIERMGDKILLILPGDKFFYGKSTHLNSYSYPTICDIITLLNCFEKIEIKVAAYTDNRGSVDENLGLTTNQAANLVSYMWQHGLDARFVYPVGYGQFCPIASNNTPHGRSQNRRIEITLTHLPPQVSGE